MLAHAFPLFLIFLAFIISPDAQALSVTLPDTVIIGNSAQASWQRNENDPRSFALRLRTDANNMDVEIKPVESDEYAGQVTFEFRNEGTYLIEILGEFVPTGAFDPSKASNLGGSNKITVLSVDSNPTVTGPSSSQSSTAGSAQRTLFSESTMTSRESILPSMSSTSILIPDETNASFDDPTFRARVHPSSDAFDSRIAAIVGGTVGSFLLLASILAILFIRRRRRRQSRERLSGLFRGDMMVRRHGTAVFFSPVTISNPSAAEAGLSAHSHSSNTSWSVTSDEEKDDVWSTQSVDLPAVPELRYSSRALAKPSLLPAHTPMSPLCPELMISRTQRQMDDPQIAGEEVHK